MKLALVLLVVGITDLVWINATLVPRALAATPSDAAPREPSMALPPVLPPKVRPAALVAEVGLEPARQPGPRAAAFPPRPEPEPKVDLAPKPEPEVDLVIGLPAEDELPAVELPPALDPIRFASGGTTLRSGDAAALGRLADSMANAPTLVVELRGHTDHRGNPRSNRRLAKQRAEAAAAVLTAAGVEERRIRVVAVGDRQPERPGSSAQARAANRRVEVLVALAEGGPQ